MLLVLVLAHAAIVLQGKDALMLRRPACGGFAPVLLGTPLLDRDAALALLLGEARAIFAGLLDTGLLAPIIIAKLVATPVIETACLFAARVGLLFASAALHRFHRVAAIAVAVEIATLVFVAGHLALFDHATLLVLAPCLFAAFAIAANLALARGFAHALPLRALFGCALHGRVALLRGTRLRGFAFVPGAIDLRTLLLLALGVSRLHILALANLHCAGVGTGRREALVATLGCGALCFVAGLARLGAALVLVLLFGLAVVLAGKRGARRSERHHHGHCAAQDACARQQPLHRLHCFPPAGATQLSLWAVSDRGA
ncbi:hypothetical protein ASD14_02325 [Lysobacter sp. Root494]|nr:hypothetical protein ASD14_02325 [Lysobacter sp. Root494]